MGYKIYIKGEPVSPAPNTSWASRQMAEDCIPIYERDHPTLKGRLEVRPASELPPRQAPA